MNIPADLKYSKSHEWVKKTGEARAQIGLTDYAQNELGDIVFVNLPAVNDALVLDESFADVESVKAVSDIYGPLNGHVVAANEALLDDPALINQDCYGAWLIEAEVESYGELMDATVYEEYIATL